jgi:D-amino-acid dehydrogenase
MTVGVAAAGFDVVVVGGGIVGVSAGLGCARAGAQVALVDSGESGQASAAGAGIVAPVGLGGDEVGREWTRLVASAIAHYDRLLAWLHDAGMADVGFSRVGELVLATRDCDVPPLEELVARLRDLAEDGIPLGRVERVSGGDVSQSWPELRPGLDGVFIENVARMDGRRMCAAVGDLARLEGVAFLAGHAALRKADGGTFSLLVDGSPVQAGSIVVAAGAWSSPMLRELGVHRDVRPVRGQILHLGTAAARTGARPVINTFESQYFLGFPEGRIVTGGTHEPEAGFDSRGTADGLHAILSRALRIAPGLGASTVVEARVGLRPRSTDGAPIVGRPGTADNVVVATGLGAWGLTLGPLAGAVAAEQALGLAPSTGAEFRGPDREPVPSAAEPSPDAH